MRLLSLSALLPVVARAGSLTLPDHAEEGLALHFYNDDGTDFYVHESNFTLYNITLAPGVIEDQLPSIFTTTVDPIAPPPATPKLAAVTKRGLPNGDNMNCVWDTKVPVSELHDGMIFFSDFLGCGKTFGVNRGADYKYVALVWWRFDTLIYTCNYSGKDKVWDGPVLIGYMEQLFNYCSKTAAASWYYDNSRKVSWGFTTRKKAYCGPAQ